MQEHSKRRDRGESEADIARRIAERYRLITRELRAQKRDEAKLQRLRLRALGDGPTEAETQRWEASRASHTFSEGGAAFLPPSVNAILFALGQAGGREAPVQAKAIAAEIWTGSEPRHGDIVQVGLRLGLMESAGMVKRHRLKSGRCPIRWAPAV
jgi:hypothetical protein